MASNPFPQDADFIPVTLRPRRDGWTAARQRLFVETLAERGCVSEACSAVGLAPKSAYRLRCHPRGAGFAAAWDRALMLATGRLVTLAFDRAINGTAREIWRGGECVGEIRAPSDKLLIFLLSKLDARRFGSFAGMTVATEDPLVAARNTLPKLLDKLADVDCPAEPLAPDDFDPMPLLGDGGLTREMS